MLPWQRGPTTPPSQQALRLQPIGFQLSVHFKGMLASLRDPVHSLRALQPAYWGRPPTSPHGPAGRRGEETETDSDKRSCPKTSGPTVLSSVLHPNARGQGAVGQSHFLWTSTRDWPCCKPWGGGGGWGGIGSFTKLCSNLPPSLCLHTRLCSRAPYVHRPGVRWFRCPPLLCVVGVELGWYALFWSWCRQDHLRTDT